MKNSPAKAGDAGSLPGSGGPPGEGNSTPLQLFLPGEPHRQRSLAGYSPWGRKESNMTGRLNNYEIPLLKLEAGAPITHSSGSVFHVPRKAMRKNSHPRCPITRTGGAGGEATRCGAAPGVGV